MVRPGRKASPLRVLKLVFRNFQKWACGPARNRDDSRSQVKQVRQLMSEAWGGLASRVTGVARPVQVERVGQLASEACGKQPLKTFRFAVDRRDAQAYSSELATKALSRGGKLIFENLVDW